MFLGVAVMMVMMLIMIHYKSNHSLTEDWAPMSFNQSAYNIHKDLKVVDAEVTLDIDLIGTA